MPKTLSLNFLRSLAPRFADRSLPFRRARGGGAGLGPLLGVLWLASLGLLPGSALARADVPKLPVYVYDSLLGEGSLGEFVEREFEAKCRCDLQWIAVGSGAQLVSRIKLDAERSRWSGAAAWGVDTLTATELAALAVSWLPERPGDRRLLQLLQRQWNLPAHLRAFVPVDFGELAWIFDDRKISRTTVTNWKTWADFFKGTASTKILMQDPRTSALGLQLLLLSELPPLQGSVFWTELRKRWRTLAPSWSAAYSLFLKGEASAVWSYSTSEAYHRESDRKKGTTEGASYFAWIPEDGSPVQLEGAILVHGVSSFSRETQGLAREFLSFLLSTEVQAQVGARQWMYPVRREVSQPASFTQLPRARRAQLLRPKQAQEIRAAVVRWERTLRGVTSE